MPLLFLPCLVLCSSQFVVDLYFVSAEICFSLLGFSSSSVNMPVSALSSIVFVPVTSHLLITLYTRLSFAAALQDFLRAGKKQLMRGQFDALAAFDRACGQSWLAV